MFSKYLLFSIAAGTVACLIGCSNETTTIAETTFEIKSSINPKLIGSLSAKRIYFGHMSVGNNIMGGLQDILRENPDIGLILRETDTFDATDHGLFAHSSIGDNRYPLKKIANFSKQIEAGIGDVADIAFFKFCYIDMKAEHDAEKIFQAYRQAMDGFREHYPKTTFVHVTIPLTVVQTGWKVPIKKLIGKAPGGYKDNINRNRYNQLLVETYSGNEPVFDLAGFESISPEGLRSSFEHEGKRYFSLYPGYARDGRHLNARGSMYVAQELIQFLGNL